MKLNKTQKDMIREAYYNLDFEYCLNNAMLIICVESASKSKKQNYINMSEEINKYLNDLDTFNQIYESGDVEQADQFARMYLQ